MTVLHISSASTWRGGEQQISYLVEGLAQKGVKQIIFTPRNSALSSRLSAKVSILTYRKGFSMNPLVALQLIRICKAQNVDLIHIHDSHAHNFVWLAYFFGLKTPSVLSRRVDFPIKSTSIRKYNHPRIKKIICVSNFIRGVVLEAVQDEAKVTTVHSGVLFDRIHNAHPLQMDQEFPHLKGKKIIGNIAALAGHKDHETFVKGVAAYRDAYGLDDLHFLIVGGEGGEEENIQHLIQELDLGEVITLIGYVDNPIDYLLAFDVFLFTSKMEGLGTSVIDAMAAKIPIISTRAGGLAELIQHERTGLSFEVGDIDGLSRQLHRLLIEEELRDGLVKSAAIRAEELSVDHMVEGTFNVYERILNTSK